MEFCGKRQIVAKHNIRHKKRDFPLLIFLFCGFSANSAFKTSYFRPCIIRIFACRFFCDAQCAAIIYIGIRGGREIYFSFRRHIVLCIVETEVQHEAASRSGAGIYGERKCFILNFELALIICDIGDFECAAVDFRFRCFLRVFHDMHGMNDYSVLFGEIIDYTDKQERNQSTEK